MTISRRILKKSLKISVILAVLFVILISLTAYILPGPRITKNGNVLGENTKIVFLLHASSGHTQMVRIKALVQIVEQSKFKIKEMVIVFGSRPGWEYQVELTKFIFTQHFGQGKVDIPRIELMPFGYTTYGESYCLATILKKELLRKKNKNVEVVAITSGIGNDSDSEEGFLTAFSNAKERGVTYQLKCLSIADDNEGRVKRLLKSVIYFWQAYCHRPGYIPAFDYHYTKRYWHRIKIAGSKADQAARLYYWGPKFAITWDYVNEFIARTMPSYEYKKSKEVRWNYKCITKFEKKK